MDPERAAYLKDIEDTFVSLRGRGFMLSPRDVGLVDDWRTRGVPSRLVVCILRTGARRWKNTHPPGVPLPSTLAYFKNAIEQEIGLRRERSLGYEAAPERAEAAAKAAEGEGARVRRKVLAALTDAGKAQEDEGARQVLRQAYRDVRALGDGEDLYGRVREIDARVVEGLLSCLDAESRRELEAAARDEAAGASAAAEGRKLRAALERGLRARFGVEDLVAVALAR